MLASNLLNPCSKLLRSLEILHHVTINHFTFFYISATLRPDSLSRQTWCELSKVSHSTCCLSCCWMVLVGPGPVSVRGGCLCLTWILCLCPYFFPFFFFFLTSSPEKGNVSMLFKKLLASYVGLCCTFAFGCCMWLIPFYFSVV